MSEAKQALKTHELKDTVTWVHFERLGRVTIAEAHLDLGDVYSHGDDKAVSTVTVVRAVSVRHEDDVDNPKEGERAALLNALNKAAKKLPAIKARRERILGSGRKLTTLKWMLLK